MKDNNANKTNVILNLFQDLNSGIMKKEKGDRFVKEGTKALGHSGTKNLNCPLAPCGTLVEPTDEVELSETACRMAEWLGRGGNPLQNDLTTCAPLEGEPKSLISKGGKNTVVYNQEPSPEFVSNVELTCVYSGKNKLDCFASAQNVANNKNVTNLFPYFPISFFLKKKIAFTLAEVLITLGIIGVVAAITIPGLINNYKANRLRSQFLKSYSTAQQAFKMMEQDDVSLDPLTYNEDKNRKFYTAYMSYFQGVINCGGRAAGNKKTLPCYDVDNPSIGYESLDGKSQISSQLFDDGQFVLQDGTLFLMENNMMIKDRLYVSVDLNGFNNPPNRWGYDLFTFQFLDGELKTMGEVGTDYTDMEVYCNPKISNNLNGIACAQKAKSNSDYFKWVVKNLK